LCLVSTNTFGLFSAESRRPNNIKVCELYNEYWGLRTTPFDNVPNPNMFFPSPVHKEALYRLSFAISSRKGAVMFTGAAGSGKTTLCHTYIRSLDSSQFDIGFITNPALSPTGFFREILYQFGLQTEHNEKLDLVHQFNDLLVENHQRGRHTILIVDEAQVIEDPLIFEELRLLLNFQLNDRFLLSLVLLGQPECKKKILKLPQFYQRISIQYHISPLTAKDTKNYVNYRLHKAGAARPLFSDQALMAIHELSEGFPRKINNICDLSLLVGYNRREKVIKGPIIRQVGADLNY